MIKFTFKVKKGDKVKITAGKDKGKEALVEKILPKKNKVLVAGVNIYKKHARPRRQGEKGGIIDLIKPLSVANVALICPKCGQISRVGFRIGDQKIRICKKCQEAI